MADSQDKLTPSDVAKLAELEKSLAKEKAASPLTKKKHASATDNKNVEEQSTKPADLSDKEASYQSSKSTTSLSPRRPATESKVKTRALWFFTVINLLLLAAIIGAGYWAWL